MEPDDGTSGPTLDDPYATRSPSPDSLEALAIAQEMARDDSSKARGVGRAEFDRGLIECGFLDAPGLRAIASIFEAQGLTIDSEFLARHLVHVGKLTRYQASALFQGKGRSLLIGPYIVLDKLGSGGMGMVFKARRRQGGLEIALKLLPPSASKHPKAVLRFRREAEIMEKLNHPNVVSSHEIGQFNGVHYLVMDYVEGRDLDKVVRAGGPMKVPRAVDCIIQAAQGLAAAHERGIVHRDIKPANLLLDTKGTVRVLDLGLARITQGEDSVKGVTSAPSLTQSGIIMGTADFLPPEQSDDSKRVDHRADIYALGCTLYYLLTGKPPYSGESIMQRLLAHHQKPIPSLRDARPDVPIEVEAVYRQMMAKSPDDRPQSVAEVAESLEAWRNRSVGARGLRVFDSGGGGSKSSSPASKIDELVRTPAGETEPYDLLTFVRDELLAPAEATTRKDPPPILARKTRRSRRSKAWTDLAIRALVAAAALAVLLRFFPRDLFRSKPTPIPPAPAVVEAIPEPEPTVHVEPAKPEVPPPTPKSEDPPAPRTDSPAEPPPPPGPTRLEELMRPPPPGPLDRPGALPPASREGATRKKGSR